MKDHSYENPKKVELGDIVTERDEEIEKLQTRMKKAEGKSKSAESNTVQTAEENTNT